MRESALLNHIHAAAGQAGPGIAIPPGDDMGAMTLGGQTVLVTVDQLAGGLHVDLERTPLEKVGRKAIARNLSDVAAMAAEPRGAVVAAMLPSGFGESRANALFDACHAAGNALNCPIFGGDIGIWDGQLLLSVTVLAEPAGVEPVLRRGARPGDTLYVTGWLGGSLESVAGQAHHLDFAARVALARQLAGDPATRPTAMIDISDGLGRDLTRLCQASGVDAVAQADRLPVSAAAEQAAGRTGEPGWRHAVADGEDYELLFTAAGPLPEQVNGVAVHAIGRVEAPTDDEPNAWLDGPDGQRIALAQLGWEHSGG